jgi:hypothetical protein
VEDERGWHILATLGFDKIDFLYALSMLMDIKALAAPWWKP